MNPEDLMAYLDGELTPEQQAEVERMLEGSTADRELLATYCRQRLMLAEACRSGAPVRVPAEAGAASDKDETASAAMKRRAGSATLRRLARRSMGPSVPWGVWAAAAGLLIAVLAALVTSPEGGRRQDREVARAGTAPTREVRVTPSAPGGSAEQPRKAGAEQTARAAEGKTARGETAQEHVVQHPPGEARRESERPASAETASAERPAGQRPPDETPPATFTASPPRAPGAPVQPPADEATPQTVAAAAPAAVARVDRAQGDVRIVAEGGLTPARGGEDIFTGQGLETSGAESLAVVKWADATRLELRGDAAIGGLAEREAPKGAAGGRGRRVELTRGTLTAEVARQPVGRPMVFVTPHAEATVLGTRFTLSVTPESTRLEVKEGLVRLSPRGGGTSFDVAGGTYAVAERGRKIVHGVTAAKPPERRATWRPWQDVSAWRVVGDVRQGAFTLAGTNESGDWLAAGAESEQLFDLTQGPVHASVVVTSDRQEDLHFAAMDFRRDPMIGPFTPSFNLSTRNGALMARVNNNERILGSVDNAIKAGEPVTLEVVIDAQQVRATAGGRLLYDGPHGLNASDLTLMRVRVLAGSKNTATRYSVKVESFTAAQRPKTDR